MKVHSNSLPPIARDLARPAVPGRNGKPEAAGAAASEEAQQAPKAAKSAETREAQGPKSVPPGLEKVQARLQELAAGERTRGQERALSAITANLARYVEQQTAATPPAATPPLAETPAITPEAPATDGAPADSGVASEPATTGIDTTA